MRRFWIGVLVVAVLAGPAVPAGPAAAAPAPQRPTRLAIGPPGEIAIVEGGYITTLDGWTTIPWNTDEDYNLVDVEHERPDLLQGVRAGQRDRISAGRPRRHRV